MSNFAEGNCELFQKVTCLKCHCHAWGYPALYFCSAGCKAEHLQEHKWMVMKRPAKDGAPEGDVPKRPNIALSAFSKEKCGKSSFNPENSTGTSKEQLQPMRVMKSNLVEDQVVEEATGDEKKDKNPVEGDGAKSKRGPLISLSRLSKLQKSRKTNTYFKLLKATVTEMQLFKPRWRFQLKTESTNGDARVKKKDMNFTFERVEDMKPNNVSSHVKRRWVKAMKCIKAIEALRPDLMFDLSTDKPQGTGMAKAHQYQSEIDRESVDVIEDPEDGEDTVDVTALEVVEEENEDDDEIAVVNVEKEIANECRICKQVALEEGEVMLYCGTNKKVEKHYGCHVTCMGLVRINNGDKLLSDIKSHYRCPDHMD